MNWTHPTPTTERARDRILAVLKRAGSHGATTWMLIEETRCSAASRRVWDLRQEGHQIEKVHDGENVYRWIYKGYRKKFVFQKPKGPRLVQRRLW